MRLPWAPRFCVGDEVCCFNSPLSALLAQFVFEVVAREPKRLF